MSKTKTYDVASEKFRSKLKKCSGRFLQIFLLCCFLLGSGSNAFAFQSAVEVSGTVTDADGLPLPGVTVMEEGTSNGTQTDFDGNYSLDISSQDAVLVFSFVGMKTIKRTAGSSGTVSVQMENNPQSLDEVVLVGYGSQTRRSITTAISKVSEEEFNRGVVTSPLDLIQGKVSGLTITRPGGNNPNSSASIQLRGVTSLTGNTQPLIVIDGIPGGNLDLLQQNDIESFDVLKGGAASAIYGTRGNNGVILITTKQGSKGVSQFEYASYISRDYVNKRPNFLSASEFRGLIDQGLIGESYDLGYSTDIFEELTNKDNFSQYHNFVASGGGENNSYRASLYYRNLDGIALHNSREEYGFRVNFNQSALNDKLNFQSTVATNFNNADLLGGGQFGVVTDWNPTAPIYAPYSVEEGTDLYNEGRYGFYQPQNGYNPFSEYANRFNLRKQQTFSGNARLSYEIIDGLQIAAFGSYQKNYWNDRYYRSTEDWNQYNPGSQYQGTAYAKKSNHTDETKTFEPTITYEKTIGEHDFDLLGGYSYQYSTTENYSMDNSGFTTDAFFDWNFGAGNAITDTDLPRPDLYSFKEDNTLIAFFSRLNYSFRDRYFLMASIRREGSSKFGVNNKWGNFPAASGAWLISDEDFMDDTEFISNLKLRVSYGITGNQGIPNYQSLVTLGTGGKYPIYLDGATEPTFYQTYGANKNPNPNLRWEKKKEWNYGVDFGFFDDRLSGTIDVYSRRTEDLLLGYTVPQPPYIQSSIYTNVGTIKNSGVELALSGSVVNTSDFSWDVTFTGNYQKNKLETLSNDVYIASELYGGNIGNPGNLGDAIRNTEGGPIGDFYGKRFAGFTQDGEWLFYRADGSVGTVSETTEEDKAILGNGVPKFNASLTNTFKYKNFDLTVFFRGKFDYDILNTVDLFYGNQSLLPGNVLNSAVTQYSQIQSAPQYSDYYLESGDFVKLDNITLGYNFNLPDDSNFKNIRVYTSARNVATFTGYTGRDPEVQDTGLYPGIDDRNFYPRTTTLSAGVNVIFK
ncbi:SusC/RagA family TonB-linked outer membrane protein [Christiangramia flava]|uniref:Putative outer membrane protein, involved in nutrient binding n=1 Tax=Christiangramia flava JLT2011 TaxID=1229726 RepID=A0A1L7I1L0_9FLAO|nr:SusC/RagA family TonB-linked outer membrane protein [Christiangramia flava]APU67015.1 putative outer membrane protein, involved in nutrient binding [Christiangramia flava JLT2011]OSS38688.1 putative outer membrane protein [Christiangramia flava JLT2011]